MNQWISAPKPVSWNGAFSLLRFTLTTDKAASIHHEKWTFLTFETQSNYQNQLKGASSLKSSLANAIRCLNHWILAPTSVSGNFYFHFHEGRFLLEMERTFGQVDSDREPSDMTSFGNVTAFFIFPLVSTLKINSCVWLFIVVLIMDTMPMANHNVTDNPNTTYHAFMAL